MINFTKNHYQINQHNHHQINQHNHHQINHQNHHHTLLKNYFKFLLIFFFTFTQSIILMSLTTQDAKASAININKINGKSLNATPSFSNENSFPLNKGNITVTEDQALSSNARNIRSTLISQGNIESGGNLVLVAGNNINNIGSNIKASGSAFIEAVNGDINITTAQLRNKTFTTWGSRKKGGTNTTDNLTNIQSNIQAGDDLIMVAGDDANIIGSKIKAADQIHINVGDDLNIVNARDSKLSMSTSKKKGTLKIKITESGSYKETAVNSQIEANQINLSADSNILIRSSDLKTVGDLNIGGSTLVKDINGAYQTDANGNYITQNQNLVNNLTIANDTLNSYSYSNTKKSYHGIAKVGANITSTVIGLTDMVANLAYNVFSPALKEIDDHYQKVAEKFLPDSITDKMDSTYARDKKNDLKNNSAYNIKVKETNRTDQTTVSSSTISAGNNLGINTNEDTTIIASNIKAGVSDTTANKTDPTIQGAINATAENLNILADQDTNLKTHEKKKTRTLAFNNWNDGSFTAGNTTNSTLTAKNDNFNLNIQNQINTSYDAKIFNKETGIIDQQYATQKGVDTSALQYLTYVKTNHTHTPNTLFNPIEEQQKQWADANRGLTEAGTAVVVIAAVAATILTAGAAGVAMAGTAAAATATVGTVATATVGVAVAGAAASTAAVSATNTSMNAEGDIFKQTKDIGHQTLKDTTSDQALKSYAIAGATALLTMGITTGIDFLANGAANTANAANGVANGAANTANAANGASNAANVANGVNTANTTLTTGLTTAFKETAIRTIANTTAQSAINGDSFSEGLKNSGKNLIINTIAQVAAQNIGELAHPGNGTEGVGQPLQLTLHAGLGCATGAALNGSGGCGAGAAAGVIGELTGAALKGQVDSGEMTKSTATQIAGLAGAAGAMFATTNDDKVSDNMFTGQNVGGNAAANNALLFAGKYPIPFTDSIKTSDDKDYDLHFGVQGSLTHNSASFGTDGFGLEADLNPTVGVGGYFNILPHGDQAAYSIITGIKNSELGSGGIIVTRQGNLGLTGSYGIAFPLYPAITNVSIPIPLDKLKNK